MFHDIRFPDDIAYGSRGGPGFATQVVTLASGAEARQSQWAQARHRYDVAYGVRDQEQMKTLKAFYLARRGAAYAFRFKDFADFSTGADDVGAPTPSDVVVVSGGGSAGTAFQMIKRYVSGPASYVRILTKPIASTLRVAVDGVERTSGVAVDANGLVTLTPGWSAGAEVTAGCEFDVPVRFTEEADALMEASIDSYAHRSARVPLVEVANGLSAVDDVYPGGAAQRTFAANITLAFGAGKVQALTASSSGLSVALPNPSEAAPLSGGAFFVVANVGATHSFTLKTHTGTTLATLAVGNVINAYLLRDAGGAGFWLAA